MTDDDFDDRPTPERFTRFTDSERDVLHDKLAVVSEFEEREITAPIDLFERPVRPTETEIVRMLRRDPARLAEYVAKIAVRGLEREREDSGAHRKALADLRELLDKPPDGRLKAALEDIADLRAQFGPVKTTVEGAKRSAWKAVLAIVGTLVGSGGAIYAAMTARSEERGRLLEQVHGLQQSVERLERIYDESRRDRPPRRDYDYDIQPRREPTAKKDVQP